MSNIIEISDFHEPELDIYARLNEVQLLHYYEPNGGLFIAESPNVIKRALDAGYEPHSILIEQKELKGEALDIINKCGNIPIYTADYEILKKLTGFPLTRGLLCAMHRRPLPSVEEIVTNARRIAILENVVNPTNVGAIFRSAAALNIDAVLLTSACSDPLYRRASRVSMGTVFQVPWTYLEDKVNKNEKSNIFSDAASCSTSCYVKTLQNLGFKTAALALTNDSVSIDHPHLMEEEKLAIILGTEGEGLLDSTIEACDYTVKIPMSHGVDSLNVAAASAVAFWQLGR
jgi:tRNA G18 (ribose-2'-O)-methylase SpoU